RGTTDIYAPNKTYHTANYAFAAFAKATWKYGDKKFHPFFSLAAGGGRIRHVVSYQRNPAAQNCGPGHNETCIDTIGAGPVLLGPGGGLMYEFAENISGVLQVNSVLAFPNFSAHVDANLGVAYSF